MNTLPIRTCVRNAAAVFSGAFGAIARQARDAGCSRQTVHEHARLVEQRLDPVLRQAEIDRFHAENQALRRQLATATAQARRSRSLGWRCWSGRCEPAAVECINSVLRMPQCRHKRMTQAMLDLKRLYWNRQAPAAGPRKGTCPDHHLGLHLPTFDFWKPLQPNPDELTQNLSGQKDAP